MSDITKAFNKINRIIEDVNYKYVRIEIKSSNQYYLIEKDKRTPLGFKAGGNDE